MNLKLQKIQIKMAIDKEYQYMCNLLYHEFKSLLDLSEQEWVEVFKKFIAIINE